MQARGNENGMQTLGNKDFAMANSQWSSYPRGKVAGGLMMA